MNEHLLEEAVNGIGEKLLEKHVQKKRIDNNGAASL